MIFNNSDKAALRRRFTSLRDNLREDERSAAEAAIYARLFDLPAWKKAPLVCGYMSLGSELDMAPVWERAVSEGKSYGLPVTVTGAKEGRMIFRRTAGFTPDELIPARFGVREPSESCPALSLRELVGGLILVPGLAFDEEGYRIGYGGGYYDRFLSSLQAEGIRVTAVGLVFGICRAPLLPREPYDIPVDYVIDERRMTVIHGIRA